MAGPGGGGIGLENQDSTAPRMSRMRRSEHAARRSHVAGDPALSGPCGHAMPACVDDTGVRTTACAAGPK